MQVILLEKIRNLGNLGDKVSVKSGYGRNYLLPRGKAASATKANLEKFEKQRAELEKQAEEKLVQAQRKAEQLTSLSSITISAKIAEEGKLYGSVNVLDITQALKKEGISVEKSEVKLPAGPIRHIGEYEIQLYLQGDISTVLKVNIIPE